MGEDGGVVVTTGTTVEPPRAAARQDASAHHDPSVAPRRRRRGRRTPYLLVLPSIVVVVAVLAYPLWQLLTLSVQQYKLRQLLGAPAKFVGLDNYTRTLSDPFFWTVTLRTILFTVAAVSLTMVIGTAVAMLLRRVHRAVRTIVTSVLVLVWAMPQLVAITVWSWMVDYEFGVVNWMLTRLGVPGYVKHDWFADPRQGFAVICLLVVWGALPFVVISLYAAVTSVPRELEEAARVDGASPWQVFRNVTLPVLKPLLVILTSLSVIWDFMVFAQVWVMLGGKPSKDYYLLGIYSFAESFGVNDYGRGAAIAVLMVLVMLSATWIYIRQMLKAGEVT